jgi:uncharacterized membrane protein
VGALVVLAAVIRIVVIDNQSIWMDEALTAYETRIPFGAMIHVVLHVETTPPLYFVAIWFWAHVFGSGDVALRSLSALAGVALVPIAYLSARELISRSAGVIAAAFVALNPFLIWYSQEARAYMLLAALSGASFLWFVRARRDPSRRTVTWWAVFSSLAIMTHFFAGFLVAPEAAWLLWVSRTRLTAVAVAVVGAVQVAMLPFALVDTSHGTYWVGQVSRTGRLSQAISEWGVSILYRRTTVRQGLLAGVLVVAVVVLLLTLRGDRRTRKGAIVAGAIAAFIWIAPLVLGLLGQDYFLSRNVIPAVVPVAVVLAAACVLPRARLLGGALAAALLAIFAYGAVRVQTQDYLQRPDWREVAGALGPATTTRAILAANGTTADPLKIYLPHVDWTEPQTHLVRIGEVDIVGATKHLPLAQIRHVGPQSLGDPWLYQAENSPVPRSINVAGATLLTRFHVDHWIVARYRLTRPLRISINKLVTLAPRYFRRTPAALLVFFEPRER